MAVINPVSRPTVSSLSLQAWTSEHSQHLLSRRVPIQYYIQYTLCCTSLVDVECQLTRDPFPFLPVTLPKKTGKREMAPARYCCCCRELCNSSRGSSIPLCILSWWSKQIYIQHIVPRDLQRGAAAVSDGWPINRWHVGCCIDIPLARQGTSPSCREL